MSVNRYNSTTGELEKIAGGTLYADAPIGSIQAYGGTTAPSGWLLCQGQAISKTEYAELFKVIGTAFGEGDGSTTFNIPNYRGKVPFGADTDNAIGTDEDGALPNIKGGITGMRAGSGGTPNGCVQTTGSAENVSTWSGSYGGWNIDASRSSTLYKDGQTTVVPANVRVNYIIKAKMIGLPSDIQSAIEEQNSYSTEETYTGKRWIDGKKIYMKVVTGLGDTYDNWNCVLLDASVNVDHIISCDMVSSGVLTLMYADGTVHVKNNMSHTDANKVVYVVEYTKTTD